MCFLITITVSSDSWMVSFDPPCAQCAQPRELRIYLSPAGGAFASFLFLFACLGLNGSWEWLKWMTATKIVNFHWFTITDDPIILQKSLL